MILIGRQKKRVSIDVSCLSSFKWIEIHFIVFLPDFMEATEICPGKFCLLIHKSLISYEFLSSC